MANWCGSTYIFMSHNKDELVKFHNLIMNTINERTEDLDSDPLWLKHIAVAMGQPDLYSRGSITSVDKAIQQYDKPYSKYQGCYYFRLDDEFAWNSSAEEFWYPLLLDTEILFIYEATEFGEEIFVNTDETGEFFDDRYYLYVTSKLKSPIPEVDESFYFSSKEKLDTSINEMEQKIINKGQNLEDYDFYIREFDYE